MAYEAAKFTDTGLVIPTYSDIFEYYLQGMREIFGNTVYLSPESPDYQQLAILAQAASDAHEALRIMWSSQDVDAAEGVALDILGNRVGLTRNSNSLSQCQAEISGTVGATIVSGIVAGADGTLWNLPTSVTLDVSPKTVTLTCQKWGPREDAVGSINIIITASSGFNYWDTVSNTTIPTGGSDIESDSSYRKRIKESFAPYGRSSLEVLTSRLANVEGVTNCIIRENDTNVTDSRGIPSHSISAVVEGGSDEDIFNVLTYKGEGVGTYGDVSTKITNMFGEEVTYSFFRTDKKPLYLRISGNDLGGWDEQTQSTVANALSVFITNQKIGQTVLIGRLWQTIMSQMGSQDIMSLTKVEVSNNGSSWQTTDYVPGLIEKNNLPVENITWQIQSNT